MSKINVKDLELKGKKVIIRCDFNVPLDDDLNITDDMRIQGALPTLKYVLAQEPAKMILMSHLGRPKGEVIEKMRLIPVANRLKELLGEDVLMLDDCIGDDVKASIANSSARVVVLENLRFHKEETKNDPAFAEQLASLADVYVNDAFGTAHRAHASTEGITKFLRSAAGFLLEKEISYLGKAVQNPEKPFVVILGGAKVSDKILLIENLLKKADAILIGGGMAYTFLKAQGKNVGNSLLEADKIDIAKDLLVKAKEAGVNIVLSSDFMVVDNFDNKDSLKLVTDIEDGWEGLDIGPATRAKFKEVLSTAKTVVWNGPVGVFEIDAYAQGTKEIAEYLATLKGVTTIVGGGDSAAAVSKFGVDDKMTHISTGGGASLEYLEGKVLPGIEALTDK
ncbi:MAG: phosphoglycerate kinase [Candidatus Omnitrophica bacterium]|nr:phosphoglycerate kinase [Candidatus Omnitrophota bacterium]MBU1997121.1 phosphoglycerate kinase [Candidatus Omnitrophota bacterium]MBU4333471.1 phosphoglycerate kinase [Candidatus Omnitrophota bacterium]